MKVSLWLPIEASDPHDFLLGEIALARNIKNKANRKAVEAALGKILKAASANYGGMAFYSDGEEILVEEYGGVERRYICGREYERPVERKVDPFLLVVVDAKEAAIGSTDGERVLPLWNDTSHVGGKHKSGGQSQARFQRGRDEILKFWLRMVGEKLRFYFDGQDIIVGGAGMTKDQFIAELPADMAAKILRVESVGYTDENGLWELLGKSRYE